MTPVAPLYVLRGRSYSFRRLSPERVGGAKSTTPIFDWWEGEESIYAPPNFLWGVAYLMHFNL